MKTLFIRLVFFLELSGAVFSINAHAGSFNWFNPNPAIVASGKSYEVRVWYLPGRTAWPEMTVTKNGSYFASGFHYDTVDISKTTSDTGPATVGYVAEVLEWMDGDKMWDWGDPPLYSSFTVQVTAPTSPPVVESLAADQTILYAGQSTVIHIRATNSNGLLRYMRLGCTTHTGMGDASYWDIGSNQSDYTRHVTVAFPSAGTYVFRAFAALEGYLLITQTDASNDLTITVLENPPSITWENPSSTVYAGQDFIVRARATDADGNLTNILMDLNGSPHRHDGFSLGLTGSGSNAYLDSYVITAGVPGVTYLFTAKARDATGIESATISHMVAVANRAPSLSATVSGTTVTEGQVKNFNVHAGLPLTFNFSASDLDDNYQRTRMWMSTNGGATWQESYNSTAASGTFSITPVASGTWQFQARSLDASGAESGTVAVIAVCPGDIIPPSTPGSLTLTDIASGSATVTWPASTDNIGVTGYQILRDGTVIGSTNGTSYTLTGLAPLTSYNITVRTMDAANNISNPGAPLAITTLSAAPNAPPILPLAWAGQYNINYNDTLGSAANDGLGNYAKYNLGFNPSAAFASASSFDTAIPAQWNTLVAAKAGTESAVGATNGSLSVDKHGASNYTIPIFAVPGANGMQPEIALVYNSQSAGGIAGYGWSLAGLSSITRGGKTFKHDGIVRGMDYSLEDQYYLDGQRLIHVGGNPHGTAGAEYRLEHENFSRIVAQGTAGQGPESFKVWTKTGRVLEYGGTSDSRLYANSANHTLEVQTWAASRVTDTVGNYMAFVYDKIATTGEQYLSQIDYTGNTEASLSPYASLEFEYESDPDSTMGFAHGSKFSRYKRIKTIRSKHGNDIIRSYALGYNAQAADMPPRSLLLQVTETGADGASYPPLTFTYSNPPAGWETLDAGQWAPPDYLAQVDITNLSNPYPPMSGDADKKHGFGDIDGDGYPDFWETFAWDAITQTGTLGIWMNRTEGWVKSELVTDKYIVSDMTKRRHVDINGDGLVDIVMQNGQVFLNQGQTFEHSEAWSLPSEPVLVPGFVPMSGAYGIGIARGSISVMDINGDGLLDMVCRIDIYTTEPNPNGGPQTGTPKDPHPPDQPYFFEYIDYMGEVHLNGGAAALNEHGTVWEYSEAYSTGEFSPYSDYAHVMVDINGDGLPDRAHNHLSMSFGLVPAPQGGLMVMPDWWSSSVSTSLNTGTGWTSPMTHNTTSASLVFGNASVYHVPSPFTISRLSGAPDRPTELLDLNGDGLMDVVRHNIMRWEQAPYSGNNAWYNTGDGWSEAPAHHSPLSLAGDEDISETGCAFLDIDGDGRIDIIRAQEDEPFGAHLNKGNAGWCPNDSSYHLPAPYVFSVNKYKSALAVVRHATASDFLDLNADGAVDQVWHFKIGERFSVLDNYDITTISKGAALNKRVHPDRLVTVTNGSGITSAITYAPLTERDADGNPTIYQKDFTPADPLDPDPVKNIIGPIYVVKTITHSAPESDTANTYGDYASEYRYGHLRSHRLHGSLGFEWMSATDTRTGITTTTRYSQEYPTIGKVIQTTAVTAAGVTLSDITTLHGIKLLNDGKNRFTFAAETESRTWNLDGTLLSHSVTITDRTGDGSDYDDYGNPLRVETISGEATDIIRSITLKTYDNTTSGGMWLLGRCLTSSVTTTQSGTSIIRTGSYAYTDTGQLLTETSEPGGGMWLTSTYTYDSFGNRDSTTTSGAGIASRTTTVDYDDHGRFITHTENALGHATTHAYEDLINQALGLPSSSTDPNGLATSWTYDGLGRTVGETRPDGTTTTTAYRWASPNAALPGIHTLVLTQSTGSAPAAAFADRWGRATHAITLAPGGISADARIVTTHTEFDNRGCVLRTWRPAWFGDTATLDVETTYDILDRPVVISKADEDITGGRVYIYNSYTGNVVEITDPNGRVERVETDLHGRQIRRINNASAPAGSPERGEVSYEYDPVGNLTATHVHREDDSMVTTSLGYDLRGRRTGMSDPDVGDWVYAYDVLGQIVSQTDAKNQTTTFDYDLLGRLVSRADPDGSSAWTYDSADNGTGMIHTVSHNDTGFSPHSEAFAYDALSRPVMHQRTIAGATYATYTEYDDCGRPYITQYPSGFRVKNVYTALGFLKEVREAGGRLNATHASEVPANCLFWQAEKFTPSGSVDGAMLGNGLTYDRIISTVTGRVKAIQSTSLRANPVQEQYYLYDALGQVTRRDDDALGTVESYTYDGLNRLVNYDSTSTSTPDLTTTTAVAVEYDEIGNITHKSDVGNYGYGSTQAHAVVSAGANTYAYDNNGNMHSGAGRTLVFTAANKVREIAQGANWSKFTFDAGRQRITQFQQDDTTMIYVGEHYEKVIHPNGQLVEEKHYIMTPFGRTAVRTVRSDGKIETRYFHQDALGSVNAVTDEYGRVEMRFAYDPWGKQTLLHDNRIAPAEGKQTRGYTDHEMLQNLGLIHMNARVYDPAISRFLSADRVVQDIGNSQSYNRYSYCINNPVNATDPTGNEWSFMDFLSAFMSLNWYDPYEAPPDDNQGGGGTADPKTDGQSTAAKNAGVASQGNGDETSTQARSLLNQGDGTSSGTVGIQAGAAQPAGQGGGSVAPDYAERDIFKNITFQKTGFLWKTSDKTMAKARDQFTQIANSKNKDGTPTQAALNILAINNGDKAVNIRVTESLSRKDYEAVVDSGSGILNVTYNPNFSGTFDGVTHIGLTILSHELAGHGFDKTIQIGYWRDYDRKYGRGVALEAMEFEAVRIENSVRNAIGTPLRDTYTFVIPVRVPLYDKYVK
jgi:RHS repeat-associated protein